MPDSKGSINENEYYEISKSIKTIIDLTSRIDERVKMIIEHQNESNDKIERAMDKVSDINQRLILLENERIRTNKIEIDHIEEFKKINTKISTLEFFMGQNNNRWGFIADAAFKIFMMIAAAILAFKLGIR